MSHSLVNSVEGQDILVVGEGFSNASEIVRIFTETLATTNSSTGVHTCAHPQIIEKMRGIVKVLCQQNAEITATAATKLNQAQQQLLYSLIV